MKRKIYNWVLVLMAIAVVFLAYSKLFKISAPAIIAIVGIIILYHFCGKLGEKGVREIQELQAKLAHTRLDKTDHNKALFYSLAILAPMCFCIVLVAFIPFHSLESWFIVGFPSLILVTLPAISVYDTYKELTGKKWPFVLTYLSIIVVIYLIGQTVMSLVF